MIGEAEMTEGAGVVGVETTGEVETTGGAEMTGGVEMIATGPWHLFITEKMLQPKKEKKLKHFS